VVSLGSGSPDTRGLYAATAANHNHDDDEHHNNHASAAAAATRAGRCIRTA
jgi:hypothetical protein